VSAYCHRGVAYVKRGDHDRGIADLYEAFGIDPNRAEACMRSAVKDKTLAKEVSNAVRSVRAQLSPSLRQDRAGLDAGAAGRRHPKPHP